MPEARVHSDNAGTCWCRPRIVVKSDTPAYRELSRIVGEMGGAVSMAWENVPGAGVFLSEQATVAVEAALREILDKFTITTKPDVDYDRSGS